MGQLEILEWSRTHSQEPCPQCVHSITHTCHHIVSICVAMNQNGCSSPCLEGDWCQAFEGVFAVSMRQLLQHCCLTYSLCAVLQADSASLSTHGCDTNYCFWVWSLDQTTFPWPHVTADIKLCSVRFPEGTRDLSLLLNIHTGFWGQPASCWKGAGFLSQR